MKNIIFGIIVPAIIIAGIIGEIKCIVKAVNCNWKPIGKAEVFYTVGSLTGFRCVMGYINIEDK